LYNVLIAVGCEPQQRIMDVALYEIKRYYYIIYYNKTYNIQHITVMIINGQRYAFPCRLQTRGR